MKKITMFTMESCPYCKEALYFIDRLYEKNAAYRSIPLELIDEVERPDIANQFDYYYVPTFYVGGKKLHEGAANMDKINRVFEAAATLS